MSKEVEMELLKLNWCVISCLGTPLGLIHQGTKCHKVVFKYVKFSFQLWCKLSALGHYGFSS